MDQNQIKNNLQQELSKIVKKDVEFPGKVNEISQTLEMMLDKIQHSEGMGEYQDDIKTYIHHQLKSFDETIAAQENTINSLQTNVNCFVRNCLVAWMCMFCTGMLVLFCTRNLFMHIHTVSQYKEDKVEVVDGKCNFCTSAMNRSCQLTVKTPEGLRHDIPIVDHQGPACEQYIESMLNKTIRILYKDNKIIYPASKLTYKETVKKLLLLIGSMVIFYFTYKKFIL